MFIPVIQDLIKNVSTQIPVDVQEALVQAQKNELPHSNGDLTLSVILENINLASCKKTPICQDTGFPTFYVKLPYAKSQGQESFRLQKQLENDIISAVEKSTAQGILRPNAVDGLTGKNSGNNTGIHQPKIYFEDL